MKKALTITVAGTLFTIEEDAYEALDAYLKSIQSHFGSDPDRAEIVKDIEARIAEQLMERKSASGIVTIDAINAMIGVMGRVEDFGDDENPKHEAPHQVRRRLYRDPDDMVIAGVCSGIAAYFGLDPIVVRLAFVILVLLGFGAGIIIYAILALTLPEADTPAEKLQMKGGPVTLDSFKESVRESVAHLNKNESHLRQFVEKMFSLFGKLARLALKLIKVFIGVGFTFGALAVGVASTFALVNLVYNAGTVFMRFPVNDAVSHPAYLGLVICAYLILLIPIIFVGATGFRVLSRKKILNSAWSSGLGALWIVAFITFGSIAVRYAPAIVERAKELDKARQEQGLSHLSHEWDHEVPASLLPPAPVSL